MVGIKAADEKACCGLCRGTPGCVASVLDAGPVTGGRCYLKAAKDVTGGNYSRPGRVGCVPNHAHCNITEGYDIGPQAGGKGVGTSAAGTPAECCDMCASNSKCVAGVFFGGQCYMKGAGTDVDGGAYKRIGRVLVQPLKKHDEEGAVALDDSSKRPGVRTTGGGACIFKSVADLASKIAKNGSMACIPSSTKSTGSFTIPATVPGELITDLQRANKVLDPLSSNNHKDPEQVKMFNGDKYTYTKKFTLPASMHAAAEVSLVMDGVKMGSAVVLNGKLLGNTTNQHRRYTFDVSETVVAGSNTLTVTFERDIANAGRFMACSGGWDWAPYSRMRDVEGNPFFTRGIWKSVYLAGSAKEAVAIESMTPTILYKGEPPMELMKDDGSHAFDVNVTFHLTAQQASGTLQVLGGWPGAVAKSVPVKLTTADNGRMAVSVTLPAAGMKLWWPRGMGGQQNLYNITAHYQPAGTEDAASTVSATRRVGFRVAYLTTGNDTDTAWVAAHRHGNGNAVPAHTIMFRINGAPVSMRGANMIPMETLEGRYVPGMHRALIKSAAAANMNLLRIWGGGVYLYEEFTDAADEEGVMIYEDMMYGTDGIMPGAAATADNEAELRYQIRRQAHHPCIIGWCGCNECGGHGVYTDFVMTTVASEDNSRVIRSSSPFGLYSSGVNTITGLPNGQKLVDIPLNAAKPADGSPWPGGAEQHGPYQHGGIFPAINGGGGAIAKPPLIVGVQPGHAVGPAEPGFMKTETGCSSLSSFESMSATLKPSEYGIHTDPFHERNYPGDPLIVSYFDMKDQDLDAVGVKSFQSQLYMNMLAAGLQRKANIESWRSTNIWAMLMWQLNEIWPTGGWGSLEYGTPVEGQVIGGRWKPLHHMMEQSAYADVTAACGAAKITMMDASNDATGPALCYIRNDLPTPFSGHVTVEAVHYLSGTVTPMSSVKVSLPAGGGALGFYCADKSTAISAGSPNCTTFEELFKTVPACSKGAKSCMLNVTVTSDADGGVVSSNMLPLALPGELMLPAADVTTAVKTAAAGAKSVDIELTSSATAVYVWLSTLEHGRFSDNAFVLLPGVSRTVQFLSFLDAGTSSEVLTKSLRVEHLQMHA